jgi:hypothetical protein
MATVSSVRLSPPLGEVPLSALSRPLCDLVGRRVHDPLAELACPIRYAVLAPQFVQALPPDAEVRSDCIRWHPGIPHAAKLFDVWHQSFARGITTPVQSPHRKTTAL